MQKVHLGTPGRQKCRFTLWAVALAMVISACGDGNPTKTPTMPPGDLPETADFRIDESRIEAELVEGDTLQVRLPIESKVDNNLSVTGAVELVGLDGQVHQRVLTASELPGGQSTALTFELTPPDSLTGGLSMNYVLAYEVLTRPQAMAKGTRSLFEALSHDQIYMLASDTCFVGSSAMIRLIAKEAGSQKVLANRPARIVLTSPDGERLEAVGQTDVTGSLALEVFIPEDAEGTWAIKAEVEGQNGTVEMEDEISMRRESRVLLTTDKPFYQPGQKVHIRTLAMRRPALVPEAGEAVTIEIQDPKGNKVFRETGETDDFGISSTIFELARELNMGTWRIFATVGDTTSEKAITVERYALPKFRVGFESDRSFYKPGETAQGTVRADYFFGKAVSGGEAVVQAWKYDIEFEQFAEARGALDDEGRWDFSLALPGFFVAQPLEQGGAFVRLDISVTDGAGHTQTLTRNLAVSVAPVLLQAIPAGDFVPGQSAEVFVLVSDPRGGPVAASGTVTSSGGEVAFETDSRGLTRVEVDTEVGMALSLTVEVDHEGEVVSKAFDFGRGIDSSQALSIKANRALYQAGDTATLALRATEGINRVFVDVLKDQQVVRSSAASLEAGQGQLDMDLSEDLVGNLQFEAYAVSLDGHIIRSHALVFVEAADDLRLRVTTAEETYQPGGLATLDIEVTDSEGEGVSSAVGLMVVDEAVFALQDFQPGMEKIYFQLEQEILKPRYEIHGHSAEEVLRGDDALSEDDRDEVAAVVFAASEGMSAFGVYVDSFDAGRQQALSIAGERQRVDAQTIVDGLQADSVGHEYDEVWAQQWAQDHDQTFPDPWGQRYAISLTGYRLEIRGFGPDELADTEDDFSSSHSLDFLFPFDEDELDDDVPSPDPQPDAEPGNGGEDNEGPRVRSFFPETLYVNPAVITDGQGRASVEVPLADSITTWRVTGMASSRTGGLGSTLAGVRVFQPFFVDINFPATLTQADEVTVPVALYNYLETAQSVTLRVDEPGDDLWYELLDEPERQVVLEAGEVKAERFRVRVTKPGWHDFQVSAIGDTLSDAVRRRVLIVPDGQERFIDSSDRLSGTIEASVVFPDDAIEGALSLQVKIYPGFFSQALEGLDSLLRMPSGCFEQTSSTTYPNVLVMQYLQATEQSNPEVELKALEYINLGYQRLLSFEVDGGGFEWFGNTPAHRILTAYGLLEFSDMAEVSYVDPALINRTQQWLMAQRETDGRWRAAPEGIHEGATNSFTDSDLRATAYITYALLESGSEGGELSTSLGWLRQNLDGVDDAYSMALVANALLVADSGDSTGLMLARRLDEMKHLDEETGAVWWTSDSTSFTYGTGSAMDIETTAYALHALLRAGGYSATLEGGTTWLIQSKDQFGNWSNTQATILTLRFLLDTTGGGQQEADAQVAVYHDDELIQTLSIETDNSDILRQIDLNDRVHPGTNDLRIEFAGTGTFMHQITGRYYTPWDEVPDPGEGPLSLEVEYDRTTLEVDEMVTVTVTVTNTTEARQDMILIDLGLPPGFDALVGDFQPHIESGLMSRVDTTGRQILVYLYGLEAAETLSFSYRLQATESLRAQTPPSQAYLYYEPDQKAESAPELLEVH